MGDWVVQGEVAWRLLDHHNARQEFEHELVDRKIRWLLSSQTILFAAYGLTLSGKVAGDVSDLRDAIGLVGIATSLLTFVGVAMAFMAKYLSWRKYQRHFGKSAPETETGKLPWGVNTFVTILSMLADLAMPFVRRRRQEPHRTRTDPRF